jgi:hypothetical protein
MGARDLDSGRKKSWGICEKKRKFGQMLQRQLLPLFSLSCFFAHVALSH